MTNPSPYEPPRAVINQDTPTTKTAAPTVGYLIGGLVQLGLGAALIVRSVLVQPPSMSLFGLLLGFLGIRTLVKYRSRTKGSGRAA